MQRKLVQQGAATLMVSLPSSWIKKNQLSKGQEISLAEIDNQLVISNSENTTQKKSARVDVTSYTESAIRTSIVNAYRSGYHRLEITYQNENQYITILNTLKNYLIGFEITKKERNYCTVENITEPAEEQFDVLFRKILYNISLLIDNTEERLKGKTEFTDYKEINLTIHQYDNFCRRVITKQKETNATLFWTFLGLLIHGQRELYHLNQFLDKNKVNFKDYLFFNNIKQVFKLLQEGFIQRDLTKLDKVHELEKKIIYDQFYKLIQKKQKENIVLYHLTAAIKDFYLATSPLIGLLLESKTSK